MFVVYVFLVLFGVKITDTRKQMAKPIALNGEYVYKENHAKEKESLVMSYEWGSGCVQTVHRWEGDRVQPTGVDNGLGPKCLVEIHNNGWMKIFYATNKDIDHKTYVNYDYVGRKYLLTPIQYRRLINMAEKVKENNLTAEELIGEKRQMFEEDEYPAYYSYGVEGMPYLWEEDGDVAFEGRLFYKEHWYVQQKDETMADFYNLFLEKNKFTSDIMKKEKDENLFRYRSYLTPNYGSKKKEDE